MDATKRQPVRRLLEESEQRYRSLFEYNPDAVFSLDRVPRFTSANPAAERLSGYLLAELLRLSPKTLIAPEHVDRTLEKFGQALAGTPSSDEVAIRDRQGQRVELNLTLVPIRIGDQITGVYGIAKDITARQRAESERATLAVENARLYQEAQQAIELRDQFLAAASHDLRTPITLIKAYAQLLNRIVSGAMDSAGAAGIPRATELLEGLQSIEDGASRITAQVDELLDLSLLHSGRPLELDRLPTDLVALSRQAAATYQQLSERHRIRVEAEQPELTGIWDAIRLERVLGNLLSNAVKYSPDGGDVIVGIRRELVPIGPQAALTVRDYGIGIPAADLPHIFERFYRAQNVSGRPGSGIGLAGVRDIVQQHGGSISVESDEGGGTSFTVRLPLDMPPDGAG